MISKKLQCLILSVQGERKRSADLMGLCCTGKWALTFSQPRKGYTQT